MALVDHVSRIETTMFSEQWQPSFPNSDKTLYKSIDKQYETYENEKNIKQVGIAKCGIDIGFGKL